MHARLNRFVDMRPELLQASLSAFKQDQLPRLAQVPGFRTIFFGVDLDLGKAAAITFWELEADLRASERAEAAQRAVAVERAGAEPAKGLVDSYKIIFERPGEGDAVPTWARLARWEGVRPDRIRDALARFQEHDLPQLEESPGFCGLIVGVNRLLGNTLSVSLWASEAELHTSLGWEREARRRVETASAMVPRSVIAESYEVALVPALERLQAEPVTGYVAAGINDR
jgi:hypothetical protein